MSRNMMNAYRLGRTIDFLLELNNAILTLDHDGDLCVEDTDGDRCSLQPLSVDSSVTRLTRDTYPTLSDVKEDT